MTEIVWGKTHCPYCEMPLPTDEQFKTACKLAFEFGDDSKESTEFDAQFCWWPDDACVGYPTVPGDDPSYARMIDLLKQRDELRADVARLGGLT